MPDTTKTFNDFYEASGLVESDISPELLKKAYDAGFAYGWAACKLVEPPRYVAVKRRRNGGEEKAKVKPDDPRPATEAQRLFIRNLLKRTRLAKADIDSILFELKIELANGDCGTQLTIGQASQLIDRLQEK
jgi:hypothetical protein